MANDTQHDQLFYGWELDAFSNNHHVIFSLYSLLFLLLLVLAFISQYTTSFIWKIRFLPDVGVIILVGMCFGGIIYLLNLSTRQSQTVNAHSYYLGFSSDVFYFGFLPPIIFNSGYHLKRKFFYRNYDAILSLAIFGTLISILIITIGLYLLQKYQLCGKILDSFSTVELVAFSSLISSTDPVSILAVFSSMKIDPTLYYIVFGESILNDSIAIIAFKTASKYVSYQMTTIDICVCFINFLIAFLGSFIIGYGSGMCSAIIYRSINFHKHIILSMSIFLVVIYLPFFLSEILQLSGVVSILYAGIASRRYITKNVTTHEKYMISFIVQLLACIGDTSSFALLGISICTIGMEFQMIRNAFFLCIAMYVFCQLSRMFHVYSLLSMVNLSRAKQQNSISVSSSNMHMIYLSGLRGAVAFALANVFPNQHNNRLTVIVVTTAIILVTVFIQGGCTEYFIRLLKVPVNVNMSEFLMKLNQDHNNTKPNECDFERKYIYPIVLRQNTKSFSGSTTRPSWNDQSFHSLSSGGGTLYDDKHELCENGLQSNSARKSVDILTPSRNRSWRNAFSPESQIVQRYSSPSHSSSYAIDMPEDSLDDGSDENDAITDAFQDSLIEATKEDDIEALIRDFHETGCFSTSSSLHLNIHAANHA